MGRKSRTKGAKGENEVCSLLEKHFPDAARDLDQYQESSGRDLRGTQPWCIQVKRHKELSRGDIDRAYDEAESAAEDGYEIPMVFYREDYKEWRVYMALTALTSIMDFPDGMCSASDGVLMVDMSAEDFLRWSAEEMDD